MNDCAVCGFPTLRPTGHAGWCERIRGYLAAESERLGHNPQAPTCAYCDAPSRARGMCVAHYQRVASASARTATTRSEGLMRGKGAWVCETCMCAVRNPYDRFERRLDYRRADGKERPHSRRLGLVCRECMEREVAGPFIPLEQMSLF